MNILLKKSMNDTFNGFDLICVDIIQLIGLKTESTKDYLNLALCCKRNSKILTKPRRYRGLQHFTKITPLNEDTSYTSVYGFGRKWSINGRLHREDGPAEEWSDGSKTWCINGKVHRDPEIGPAIKWKYPNSKDYIWYEEWQVDGVKILTPKHSKKK